MYSDFVADLGGRVESLAPRSKAAVFWVLGCGMLSDLDMSAELASHELPADWANWFAGAREAGYRFVTAGEVEPEASALWARAVDGGDTGEFASTLINSAVNCLGTPLGIAIDPEFARRAGSSVEGAFEPLFQSVSLELFEDVAVPDDDEEIDEVFVQPRFQVAVNFVVDLVARLSTTPTPDAATLDTLLSGAHVLAPPTNE
jgi:hypothetical protein